MKMKEKCDIFEKDDKRSKKILIRIFKKEMC